MLLPCTPLWAKNKTVKKRPKIGLVLSGGGAKGFAHIGVIKVLEEAGIRPDYITGTSMGSIIGALYAIGYTTEQLTAVANSVDWDKALSNTVSLNEIAQEEKYYADRYVLELSISKEKISLPGGLIEGQNLQELLSYLTRNVHHEPDFLKFPIPYACVATNIETGKPVTLNHGNLALSIRASMAIPSIFTPVTINDQLLIDGGWVRNLPVQEARDMGADIIIAVDVGAPLQKKEELTDLLSILDQTAWLLSTQDTEQQRRISDYIISPDTKGIASFDFDKAEMIIERGYKAAHKQLKELKKLARKTYSSGHVEPLINVPPFPKTYSFSKIEITGTKYTSIKFVKGILDIEDGELVTAKEIDAKISRLYGSTYYKKVTYSLKNYPDGNQVLQVDVIEDAPAQLKFGIYFDNESSGGITANLTLRNLALKNSRLILDTFIAKDLQIQINYLKYLDKRQKLYLLWGAEYSKDSNFRTTNIMDEDATYIYRIFNTGIGLAFNFNQNISTGFLWQYRNAWAKPDINADPIIKKIRHQDFPATLFFAVNTLDKAFFPTDGWRTGVSASYRVSPIQKVTLLDDNREDQAAIDKLAEVKPYWIFEGWLEKFFRVTPNASIYTSASLYLASHNNTAFNDQKFIGGVVPIFSNSVQFVGSDKSAYISDQLARLAIGVQFMVIQDLYLKFTANYFNFNYPAIWISQNLEKNYFEIDGHTLDSNFGGGIEIAYDSKIGPIRLVVHQDVYSKKPNFFIGIGYPFRNIFPSF